MARRNTVDVIVGGQFGSESKGRVTLDVIRERLAQRQHVHSVRVAGPNAGHVVIDSYGERWAMRQLPVGFVEPEVQLVIAAGSEIDAQVLESEIIAVEAAGYLVRGRLWIHPEATYLEPHHIHQEQDSNLTARLGSTAKGIGAARADRIWRNARRVKDAPEVFGHLGRIAGVAGIRHQVGVSVVIEGTQGYGLGLHAGYYPQCTSSDARAIDFLAMAGISPWDLQDPRHDLRVWVVIRPYPIRVAGNSGELAGETTWDRLGLPEEKTTVTQKTRRVGTFEPEIVQQALEANGYTCTRIALAMADQVAPSLAGAQTHQAISEMPQAEAERLQELLWKIPSLARLQQIGTGPDSHIDIDGTTLLDRVDTVVRNGGSK